MSGLIVRPQSTAATMRSTADRLVLVDMRLREHRDMAAAKAVAGDALAAARHAALPAAERRRGRQAARQPRVAAEHADAERHRLGPRDMREFVDEAFGEEAGVAVRARPPMPGRHADIGRVMIDRIGRDLVERRRARHRIAVAAAGQRQRRRAVMIAGEQPPRELAPGRGRGDLRQPAGDRAVDRRAAPPSARPRAARSDRAAYPRPRDQISWTGRLSSRASTAACTAASMLQRRPERRRRSASDGSRPRRPPTPVAAATAARARPGACVGTHTSSRAVGRMPRSRARVSIAACSAEAGAIVGGDEPRALERRADIAGRRHRARPARRARRRARASIVARRYRRAGDAEARARARRAPGSPPTSCSRPPRPSGRSRRPTARRGSGRRRRGRRRPAGCRRSAPGGSRRTPCRAGGRRRRNWPSRRPWPGVEPRQRLARSAARASPPRSGSGSGSAAARRLRRQLAEAQLVLAVHDEARRRAARLPVDAPALRRRLAQQHARRRARLRADRPRTGGSRSIRRSASARST